MFSEVCNQFDLLGLEHLDHGRGMVVDLITWIWTERRVHQGDVRLKLLACYKTMDIFAW